MELLKSYIFNQVANHSLSQQDAKKMLIELKEKTERQEEEIAIIGIAGRFPKANSIQEYWNNIKNGVVCIDKLPEGRVNDIEDFLLKIHYNQLVEQNAIKEDGHLDLEYQTRGYMYEIDKFDAAFFGIPPREAKAMDPDQRIFLELAYEAVEDAGYGRKIIGTNTGVFAGIDHVSDMKYKQLAASDPMVVTGTWPGILASRVSYIFDLHGPSIVIDTACSSGMVSVHSACNSLRNGECDMAIAGGLSSFYYRPMRFDSELKELESVESSDDIVRTFDKNANGTVWGEGVGAVFLKPLKKALEDKDPIYAVIKASAINNDGASNGITAPDARAQERLLKAVWEKAKINPETVQYIEAHGTGTILGDPIEIEAVTSAFRSVTDKKQFCGVGTVKTSIGHLVGASGLAALLKVVLMLKNKLIPASLNFKAPNPYINFCESPVYVTDKPREWQRGEAPRRAGINSFGFSGTNCHVLLEEAPEQAESTGTQKSEFDVFTMSAKTQNALQEMLKRYYKELTDKNLNMSDACYTANTGRGHYNQRLVFLVKDMKDLKDKIDYVIKAGFDEINKFGVYYGVHKIVPSNKLERGKGEITEAEHRKLNRLASAKMDELKQDFSYPSAAELCELYIKGAGVEWELLYEEQNRNRINLPVYPLERKRCWYDEKPFEKTDLNGIRMKAAKEIAHPLIDRCLAESFYQDIYATDFSVGRHWVLSDHKILGSHVIPGTTYIEMAVEVCKKYYGCSVELRNIIFYAPVITGEKEVREVHTILNKQEDHIEVTFASRINLGDFDEQWVKHAECKVYKAAAPENEAYDVRGIIDRLLAQSDEAKLIDTNKRSTGGAQLGERWKNSKTLAVGLSEALIQLELPVHISEDAYQYYLHVSMLDNSVNAISQDIGEGLYLPFMYKSLKIYGRMPQSFYSHIKIKENNLKGMETITFDVLMMDSQGRVFAEATDYSIKKVNEEEFKNRGNNVRDCLYFETSWIDSEPADKGNKALWGNILVFKDDRGIGDEIARRAKALGSNIIEVEYGDRFEKLKEDRYIVDGEESGYQSLLGELAGKGISGIIHIMSVSALQDTDSPDDLKEHQKRGIYSLFNLTRALVANKFSSKTDIVLISDYANEVVKTEKRLCPHNAALFGIGKIVRLEHSNLNVRCIDIDDYTTVDSIMNEICSGENVFKVAYRDGMRFIEEFRKIELSVENSKDSIDIKEDGSYIITGGTGSLGLAMAKHLAAKSRVRIALINRSVMPQSDKWDEILDKGENLKLCNAIAAIREIEKTGSRVGCYSGDVSSLEDMRRVVAKIRKEHGAVRGIIHCAGLAGDGFIMRKKKEAFDGVISPKMQGTWILDELTCEDNPDFFVMFSSILSVFGDPGQGDYTAANSYMDTYAAYRSRKGKRTVAINWPAWKEIGMAVDYGISESDTTIRPITTEKAMKSFDEILSSKYVRVLPGDLNYSKLIKIKDELPFRLSERIEDVLKKQRHKLDDKERARDKKKEDVKISVKGREQEELNETENKLVGVWSDVLGLGEIDIYDTFSSLGGDSMMAIQLLKQVNKEFGDVIDISDVFSYPSIEQMASFIEDKLGIKKEQKNTKKESKEDLSLDESIESLFDNLESGEQSIEDALKILGSGENS